MNLSIETCVIALNAAAMNRKAAVQLELCVGLSLFHTQGGASREARTLLTQAYAASGYRCTHVHEMDYKTVNRRINATADLYEKLPVAKWAGKLSEDALLQAVHMGIVPYEFFTIADVMRFCSPGTEKAAEAVATKPHASILSPAISSNHTGQDKVMVQFRRAADRVLEGHARQIGTPHLALVITEDTPREEMIELAMQLLEIAKAKDLLLTE